MMLASVGIGRTTLKIMLSLVLAGAVGFGVLVLLEALLPGTHQRARDAALFRFQFSAMIAVAVFAGLAIVIYVRLSRKG
ncbi:MAG: hypothetical protein WA510_08790 [Acidobacteriaceae bacterium]